MRFLLVLHGGHRRVEGRLVEERRVRVCVFLGVDHRNAGSDDATGADQRGIEEVGPCIGRKGMGEKRRDRALGLVVSAEREVREELREPGTKANSRLQDLVA